MLINGFYKTKIKFKKANAIMRGKPPPSEHILEKIKTHNSFGFSKGLEKAYNFWGFSKYHYDVLVHVYLKKDKN